MQLFPNLTNRSINIKSYFYDNMVLVILTGKKILIMNKLFGIFKDFFYNGPVKDVPNGSRNCPTCNGTGNYDSFIDCVTCDGQGNVDYEMYIKAIQKIEYLRE